MQQINKLENYYELALEHGINLKERCITLSEEISETTFSRIDSALTILESENIELPVIIKINSPGGSVYDALAIVGRIRSSPCEIITEGYGCIMSAAALVLVSGHTRRMSQYAWFMYHEMANDISGKTTDLHEEVRQMKREQDQWATIMHEFTDVRKSKWLSVCKKKDYYLSANQCLEMKIVDVLL